MWEESDPVHDQERSVLHYRGHYLIQYTDGTYALISYRMSPAITREQYDEYLADPHMMDAFEMEQLL